jgi:ribA/ribD-fused uncharacterized protein
MTDEATTIVALLHDVVEDTDYTLEDIAALGFGQEVVDAVALMTHADDVPYLEYVAKLRGNPLARVVKLADLNHNSDMLRLDTIDEKALARVQKYHAAIALLESKRKILPSQPMVFFWKDTEENGCFSNWYRRPFVIDGVQYPHVEQYMMSQKAKLFHDEVRYAAILRTENPNDCKKLGKQVTPFDPKTWDGAKYEIVKAGNRAKFEQNPDLKEKLLATGTAILAEASPRDKTWGIGKTAKTAAETDPSAWPGQNLLGKILMELREEFAANPTTASLQEK